MCWHHKITKITLFLDMSDLWSWISHLSLIPLCPPIHNTLHFCSAAFLHKSPHKLSAPSTSSTSSLPAWLFSTNLSFNALYFLSLPISPKTINKKQKTPKCPLKTYQIWLITFHTVNIPNSNKPQKLDSPKYENLNFCKLFYILI